MNDEIKQAKKHISAAQEHAALSAIHLALAKKLELQHQFYAAMANTSYELAYLKHKISEQKAKLFNLQNNSYKMFDLDFGLKSSLFQNEVNYELGELSYNYAWLVNYAQTFIEKAQAALQKEIKRDPSKLVSIGKEVQEEKNKFFREGFTTKTLGELNTKLLLKLEHSEMNYDLMTLGYEGAALIEYFIKHHKDMPALQLASPSSGGWSTSWKAKVDNTAGLVAGVGVGVGVGLRVLLICAAFLGL